MKDKKNTLDTNASKAKEKISHLQDSTGANVPQVATRHLPTQILKNLPHELLAQPRWFLVDENKRPLTKGWNNPDNQRLATDINLEKYSAGFDTCGHGTARDYVLLDFDHVLASNGKFVNPDAARWFNLIVSYADNFYCEKSISGQGLHILLNPTPDKFSAISAGKRGTLHFGDNAKLEIFYKSAGRYCLFTGDVYQCQPKAPIIDADTANDIFQKILDELEKRQAVSKKSAWTPEKKFSELGNDYDSFRAEKMLDTINPADLDDSDWLAVMSACKNIGVPYSLVDSFNQRDPDRYNAQENQNRWDSLCDTSFEISTLHGIAKRFVYREADARRQWYDLHPDLKPSANRNIAQDTKRELDDAIIFLDTLEPENFTANDARDPDNLHAVALAQTFGFTAQAENFFIVIKKAKEIARICLKDVESDLAGPIPQMEKNALTALVEGVNIKSLRNEIDREVTEIKRAQNNFHAQQAKEKERAEAIKRAKKRKQTVEDNIQALIELRAEYQKNPSPFLAAQIQDLILHTCDVKIDRYTGEIKRVEATQKNADLIFTFDPNIDGLIGYDQFKQADVLLKPPIWSPDTKKGEEWSDRDDSQLQTYLRKTYTEFISEKLILNSVTVYSDAHRFHEVKEFFHSLPTWDGKTRAEKLFVKFLGAKDEAFTREVTLNILTAAVARIFHPGCDYQLAPILLGEQGIGKSYLLGKLFGKWYGSLVDDVSDPHAIDAIQKLWGVEIKEMAAMKKDIDANKRFIDSAKDTRRQAYARRATTVPRHCVFLITTNNKMCLTDMTGNRRYPIIVCNNKARHYVEGLTNKYILQVWAEVFAHYNELFKDGFDEKKLELSRDAQIQSDEIAEEYLRDDGLATEIQGFLDTRILPLILWHLLTREERRKFIADGRLVMIDAVSEFNHRRRARGGKESIVQRDVDLISSCLTKTQQKHWLRIEQKTIQGNNVDEYILYGSELRQHICAVEIYNECFGNDRRKSPTRIHEVLNNLDGWHLGARIRNLDPAYLDQKKVFYRNDN